jgi:hypothetical protein
MLNKGIFIAALLVSAPFAQPVFAGPVADKAVEIEGLMESGDDAATLAAASALFATVWDSTKAIGISQAILVTEPASGVGIYNPKADEKYAVGEPIYIYAEPFGYGYGAAGEGLHSIAFAVDLKVMTETGEVLAEKPSIATLELTSRHENREFQANLTYTLNGIPPGRYVLETNLRDKNSEKFGTFQNTVEFTDQIWDRTTIDTTIDTTIKSTTTIETKIQN